jgi:hypothetical protein
MKEELIKEIKDFAEKTGGKITCAKAWELADKYSLKKKEIGELINELKIKITHCQLGCF